MAAILSGPQCQHTMPARRYSGPPLRNRSLIVHTWPFHAICTNKSCPSKAKLVSGASEVYRDIVGHFEWRHLVIRNHEIWKKKWVTLWLVLWMLNTFKCLGNLQAQSWPSTATLIQIARFWATMGPPGSCRSQIGPMLAPWILLSGNGQKSTTFYIVRYCLSTKQSSLYVIVCNIGGAVPCILAKTFVIYNTWICIVGAGLIIFLKN